MKWCMLACLAAALPCWAAAAVHHLPKNFKQCKQSDPLISKCLQKAVPDALKKMKTNGIPSLGVLALEPLVIDEIKIDPGAGRPVNLKLQFSNIRMYGIPDTTLLNYDARIKEGQLLTDAYSPKLWFEADYVTDGKVLLLPIRGQGKCNVTMYEMTTGTDLKFKQQKKNGETYWIIQSFDNKFQPKKVSMYFDGLFGDNTLSVGINQFLNENWKTIFEELRPSFEKAFGEVFKEITHRVFSKVPLSKVFLS